MEKYKKLDMVEIEAGNLETFEREISVYTEKYANFIFTTKKENLGLKFQTPIETLKKLVKEVYGIDFVETDSLLIVTEGHVIAELLEETGNLSKEVFVLLNEQGILIDFNK